MSLGSAATRALEHLGEVTHCGNDWELERRDAAPSLTVLESVTQCGTRGRYRYDAEPATEISQEPRWRESQRWEDGDRCRSPPNKNDLKRLGNA